MNIIGQIVVAGNVRRSAEIALGSPTDLEFLNAKNWSRFKVPAWRQHSNNSVITPSIFDLPSDFWEPYEGQGEPYGLINLDLMRRMGRLADGPGYRPDPNVIGVNPCSEMSGESHEACNLFELYLPRLEDINEFVDAARLGPDGRQDDQHAAVHPPQDQRGRVAEPPAGDRRHRVLCRPALPQPGRLRRRVRRRRGVRPGVLPDCSDAASRSSSQP